MVVMTVDGGNGQTVMMATMATMAMPMLSINITMIRTATRMATAILTIMQVMRWTYKSI